MSEFDYIKVVKYLNKYETQKRINKLSEKYKRKRIVLFGAGQFAQVLFQNFDLSQLNIIAIADKKFEQEGVHEFFGLNCVKPNDLKKMTYDVILISNLDYKKFVNILDEKILYGTENAGVEIRPLINLDFKDILW